MRVYVVLFAAGIRSSFQYRANSLLIVLGGIAYQGIGFAFIGVVLTSFGAIGGWTLDEVAFLYGIRLAGHAVFAVVGSPLFDADTVVRRGEFDRYLLRPAPILGQLITRRFGMQTVGDALGGMAFVVIASSQVEVHWTAWKICFLFLAILGGGAIEFSVHLAIASLAFRFLTVDSLRLFVDDLFGQFGNYPMLIFPSILKLLFVLPLPLAFSGYFPSTVLLGKTDELIVPGAIGYISPLVGVVMLLLSYALWKGQTKHYRSGGS